MSIGKIDDSFGYDYACIAVCGEGYLAMMEVGKKCADWCVERVGRRDEMGRAIMTPRSSTAWPLYPVNYRDSVADACLASSLNSVVVVIHNMIKLIEISISN